LEAEDEELREQMLLVNVEPKVLSKKLENFLPPKNAVYYEEVF